MGTLLLPGRSEGRDRQYASLTPGGHQPGGHPMELRTVLVRLDSSTHQMQSELNIQGETTVSQLLRTAEQHFELDQGALTAVCWDDEQEPGLEISRDREVTRLMDWDQLCFKCSSPVKNDNSQPCYVDAEHAFPSMDRIQADLKEVRKAGRNLYTKWSLNAPSESVMSHECTGDPAWLTNFTPDEIRKISSKNFRTSNTRFKSAR